MNQQLAFFRPSARGGVVGMQQQAVLVEQEGVDGHALLHGRCASLL